MLKSINQLKGFVVVGALATSLHVVIATMVEAIFETSPLLANFIGFSSAVMASYLGHTKTTFAIQARHQFHFPRFLFVSLVGLTLSSLITLWGVEKLGFSFAATMLVVGVVVPLFTFFCLKFWALRE
ncbi:GtrA family protein [Cognatishimia activa]|uniref:GtrA-like protein n=1 Tax=Cognatishimia activa TaxID=1715691 RepID=A0A0P1IVB0_9RHOB|nr:GtrA family protein [Cognatishimia activa]CUJ17736.1 GtrA-like protein [Cognatishimia activa]CUK27571.1 GtrA-like protein [Cognatishimia activa]